MSHRDFGRRLGCWSSGIMERNRRTASWRSLVGNMSRLVGAVSLAFGLALAGEGLSALAAQGGGTTQGADSASAAAPLSAARAEERPELQSYFADLGTHGTFVAKDMRTGRVIVVDEQRARRGYRPQSTFKIANALIALETGVAQDADHPVFKWDGRTRAIEAWNQDHTLRSAVNASALPVFQEIARRIGHDRMKALVRQLGYGNADIGGAPVDRFWLAGNLHISAYEQIVFLERLYRDELRVSKRAQAIVKDIMLVEKGEGYALRGKTGSAGKGGIGWFVGWVERGQDVFFFALNLDLTSRDLIGKRIPTVKALLGDLGML
ncbi:class D beta-lactamase [Chelatococcus sp. SYSU_G07232]|uniref:Beta-lactamase n=1 Tax=Chelatococcus albus TaxID=3047466 RepID=A0ABT7AD02_9HYPH|nr:class D beta-lactamase [Chelatococcus sp. SYSU_G07232]MDJ1157265.1 class D beta-lactamase [Chelatococcus sp. SYSU_G07232]